MVPTRGAGHVLAGRVLASTRCWVRARGGLGWPLLRRPRSRPPSPPVSPLPSRLSPPLPSPPVAGELPAPEPELPGGGRRRRTEPAPGAGTMVLSVPVIALGATLGTATSILALCGVTCLCRHMHPKKGLLQRDRDPDPEKARPGVLQPAQQVSGRRRGLPGEAGSPGGCGGREPGVREPA